MLPPLGSLPLSRADSDRDGVARVTDGLLDRLWETPETIYLVKFPKLVKAVVSDDDDDDELEEVTDLKDDDLEDEEEEEEDYDKPEEEEDED